MNTDSFKGEINKDLQRIQHIRDDYDDLRLSLEEMDGSEELKQAVIRLEESRMWLEAHLRG